MEPKIFQKRSMRMRKRQNAPPSFEAAIKQGCERIEYDLHWTAERVIDGNHKCIFACGE